MTTEIMKRWTRVGLDVCNVLMKSPVPPDDRVYELRRLRDQAESNLGVAVQEAARALKSQSDEPTRPARPSFHGGRLTIQKGGAS
jgi:hypothetical protein